MSFQDPATVLIVEDDAGCIELIRDVLADLGLEAVIASTVQGAREAARSENLRLIILDIMLSDGDGLAVLDLVRSEPRTAQIPVVVCTAALFELQASRDLSADPFTEVIVKPFHIKAFLQAVGSLLAV